MNNGQVLIYNELKKRLDEQRSELMSLAEKNQKLSSETAIRATSEAHALAIKAFILETDLEQTLVRINLQWKQLEDEKRQVELIRIDLDRQALQYRQHLAGKGNG